MKRPLKLAATVLCVTVFSGVSTQACICEEWYWDPVTSIAASAWVGSGKVINCEARAGGEYVNTVEVYEIWKGEITHEIQILTADAPGGCGRGALLVGVEYLIFAREALYVGSDVPYYTDACDPTQHYSDPLRDVMGPPLAVDVASTSWGTLKAKY